MVKIKNKKTTNKKKTKKKKKKNIEHKDKKFNIILVLTFLIGVLFIFASYAWFYSSLDVKIDFFKMTVSNESGLFISLDGKTYSSSIVVSKETLINNLKSTYPNNTSQWPTVGLYPVSSNGIRNQDSSKFAVYAGKRVDFKPNGDTERRFLDSKLINEKDASTENVYLAFDIFLKNVSGSPYPDNLYFNEGTSISYNNKDLNDEDGTINSIRIGLVKIGSTSSKSDINVIQNLDCNNSCQSVIYEPNSGRHSMGSIQRAKKYGINLIDGVNAPTYAVIDEGEGLEIANGHDGSGTPLDPHHFALQNTVTNFTWPLFKVINGVTKVRVYVWQEGQDADSLETTSGGASISIVINLLKDLAGYN